MNETINRIFYSLEPCFSAVIEDALKQLLCTKHLYQSIKINYPDFGKVYSISMPKLISSLGANHFNDVMVQEVYKLAFEVEWQINNPEDRIPPPMANPDIVSIKISPPTVRGFCQKCQDIEPYNFVRGRDTTHSFSNEYPTIQVFAITYVCQGCKDIPEVFLIRRDEAKLTLCGRAPIEEVIVAPQIPKSHNKYISDATVAYNSGQVLAGIFLLRTFIEQYVRSKSKTPNTDNIDLLFGDYATTLPDDFKPRFPSLSNTYDKLSTAIHTADSSEEIYSRAKEDIEHHFEGKKAFRIT